MTIPSESHVYTVSLTFTFLPETAEPLAPNTNVSVPSEGAVKSTLVEPSIFKHVVRVNPAYCTDPLLVDVFPFIL